jgi:hypothetical protein
MINPGEKISSLASYGNESKIKKTRKARLSDSCYYEGNSDPNPRPLASNTKECPIYIMNKTLEE